MSIHNPFNLPLKREDVFDIRDSYWSTGQLKSTLDFKCLGTMLDKLSIKQCRYDHKMKIYDLYILLI